MDRRRGAESSDSPVTAGRFSMFSICSAVSSVKGKVTAGRAFTLTPHHSPTCTCICVVPAVKENLEDPPPPT